MDNTLLTKPSGFIYAFYFIVLFCEKRYGRPKNERNETVMFRIKYVHVKGILSQSQPSERRCSHDLLMLTLGDKLFVYMKSF